MTKTRAFLNLDRIRRLGLTPDLPGPCDGREAREVPGQASRIDFASAGGRTGGEGLLSAGSCGR